jgi:hypothetical protein
MFYILQNELKRKYGVNNPVTSRLLSNSNRSTITPEISNARPIQRKKPNWTDLQTGASSRTIAQLTANKFQFIPENFGYDSAYILSYPIKMPGQNEYLVPEMLKGINPFIQESANHFVSMEKNSEDYFASITLRVLPLSREFGQVNNNWHLHKPTNLKEKFYQTLLILGDMAPIELPDNYEIDMSQDSVDFFISSIVSSEIQIKEVDTPLKVTEDQMQYNLVNDEFPTDYYRQAKPYEIVGASSQAFHKAANVPKELIGQRRAFAFLSHEPCLRV